MASVRALGILSAISPAFLCDLRDEKLVIISGAWLQAAP